MKERPILFSAPMVRAILDGSKTQTRRVVKGKALVFLESGERPFDLGGTTDSKILNPYGQPGDRLWCRTNYMAGYSLSDSNNGLYYGLTDDRIMVFHNHEQSITTAQWSPVKSNPDISEQGLHGGVGRSDLLTDAIQRLWQKGVRGLVSAKGFGVKQGLPEYITMPQKQKGDKSGSPISLHGFSWDAAFAVLAGSSPERGPKRQQTRESKVGVSKGQLDGQKGPRAREHRGEASNVETDGYGSGACCMGNPKGAVQPKACSRDLGTVAGWHLCHLQTALLSKPSIHMPRWASRITLEITGVKVERLQEISNEDALSEGTPDLRTIENNWDMRRCFQSLWQDINGADLWAANPWVWVIEFKRAA